MVRAQFGKLRRLPQTYFGGHTASPSGVRQYCNSRCKINTSLQFLIKRIISHHSVLIGIFEYIDFKYKYFKILSMQAAIIS